MMARSEHSLIVLLIVRLFTIGVVLYFVLTEKVLQNIKKKFKILRIICPNEMQNIWLRNVCIPN